MKRRRLRHRVRRHDAVGQAGERRRLDRRGVDHLLIKREVDRNSCRGRWVPAGERLRALTYFVCLETSTR
jgi:hypothetical protein